MFKGQCKHLLGPLVVLFAFLAMTSSALAASAAPAWEIRGNTGPTSMRPGSEGNIELEVYNIGAGSASAGAVVTDILPAGLKPTDKISGFEDEGWAKCGTIGQTVTCVLPEVTNEDEIGQIYIGVEVSPKADGHEVDIANVAGGGATRKASTAISVSDSSTAPSFGFSNLDTWITNADGTTDTQAGSHPYDMTVAWSLNTTSSNGKTKELGQASPGSLYPEVPIGGELRNINVNVPAGIVGDPDAVPRCTRLALDASDYGCPVASQVGFDRADIEGLGLLVNSPVYNMVPPPGIAAQFAFDLIGVTVFLDAGVRTGGDNGITVHVNDVPERNITFNSTTLWGTPAESSHDMQREGVESTGEVCGPGNGNDCPAGVAPKPFLTLPTSCQGPQEVTAEALGTWEDESLLAPLGRTMTQDSEGHPVGFTGCERLQPFKPEVSIAPDTTYADTPAGLSVDVRLPQGLNPEGLATPGLQGTTVVLPQGLVINPGQATGLQACQPSEEALGSLPDGEVNEGPASCPSASKVGTDEITTPLLPNKLQGSVYILSANPPNMQMLITASGEGVNLKLLGNIHLNETTGQLTTTFDKTPDLPFSDFKLSFSGGAQAALATPTGCGAYESTADFTPWSSPFIEEVFDSSRFQITSGPLGSPCTNPMSFAPTMTAGSTTDQAGGFTGFTMLLQRGDEQQRIKSLSFKTPEGLLGMIAKVPLCEEPQAAQGTCSSASQIGHTVVGTGPGPYPFYVPQAGAPPAPIYLTGPYKNAPFGLSIVVPLIAGPFNLGTEIVRATINVDPITSRLTIATDPLPLTVKGIPTDLRSINAVIDRPEFMFNPTDCKPQEFSGTATSVEDATAPLETHFQMGSCQSLKFQPNFKVSTSGKTSRAKGASLTAKIIYPVGNLGDNQASSQSNIQSVKVDLPKQLPSRLTTLQKACPARTFEANPASCPADSIVGHGKAITPLLPVPIEGPAYFVSHAGEEFPNLVVVLQGDNVTVNLVGSTFINTKTNITSSTFKNVPDVPIQTFELNLPEGKYSALAANTNLCRSKLEMPTAFTGQNGAVIHQSTPVSVMGCPKHKTKTKAKGKTKPKIKTKKH